MKKQLPAWAALCIIALVAGLLLGATNAITEEPIAEQTLIAADEARTTVLPGATSFVEQELPEGALVDNCYAGMNGDTLIGYTAQSTVNGYGGKIEVTTGMDLDGVIMGISVGGPDFSETAGLGAKTKEAAFTDQFKGITPPVRIRENVDAVTSASISSGAVVSAVNRNTDYMLSLFAPAEEPSEGSESSILPGATALEEQAAADGIDMWWKAENGRIVQVSKQGFGGPVQVKVGIYEDGTIAGIEITAASETPGIGERVVSEADFAERFIGKSAPLDGVDTLSGATISSTAVLEAVKAALAFSA